jgi:hypothetical protein
MQKITMEFSPMEHATLLSLVALGISVMQGDEDGGREHVILLSSPGIEAQAKALVPKLLAPLNNDEPEVITINILS